MKNNNKNHSFSQKLLEWYNLNKRSLPWRQTKNPYHIWLSEIILQQTRVDQGMPYYMKFVESFPQVEMLATASEDEVLKLWQGLGYYSRARNLHATAQYIVEHCGGTFPQNYKDVLALKGVGEYTAAAIVSFAYDQPYATVDGNVFRVLARIFGVDDYIDTSAGKRAFTELAAEMLDKGCPGVYNQAIMDFGSLQCVPKSPNCVECPFSDSCFAYNKGMVDVLPRKKGRVVVRNRFFNYLDIRVGEDVFLAKRNTNDIWKGLYEFPLIETSEKVDFHDLSQMEEYRTLMAGATSVHLTKVRGYKHVLSHQVIYAFFFRLEVDFFDSDEYFRVDGDDLGQYAVSRLIEKYLLEV